MKSLLSTKADRERADTIVLLARAVMLLECCHGTLQFDRRSALKDGIAKLLSDTRELELA